MKGYIKKVIACFVFCTLLLPSINITAEAAAVANPTWYVEEPVIFHGEAKPYDYYGQRIRPLFITAENIMCFIPEPIKAEAGRCSIPLRLPYPASRMHPEPI